jgi:hypothetical protein
MPVPPVLSAVYTRAQHALYGNFTVDIKDRSSSSVLVSTLFAYLQLKDLIVQENARDTILH